MADAELDPSVELEEESLDEAIAAELDRAAEPRQEEEAEAPEEGAEPSSEATEAPESEETAEETSEAEEEKLTPHDHWRAEYKETFNSLSRGQQEKWMEREREFERGFQAKSQELAQARQFVDEVRNTVGPLAQEWARQGLSPSAGLRRAMAREQAFRENPQEALLSLAKDMGVDLQSAVAQQPYQDPAVQSLEQKLQQQERQMQEWQMQQQRAAQQAEQQQRQVALSRIMEMRDATDEQGNPRYPYFEQLMTPMAEMMEAGRARDMETAYNLAVEAYRNHPVVKDLVQGQTSQKVSSSQASVERAKKASKVVDSGDTSTAPPSDNSLDADILQALEAQGL